MNVTAVPITVSYGDGIGPEVMDSVLRILREAGAAITVNTVELGERIYKMGSSTGILPSSVEQIEKSGILLRAPCSNPIDKGCLPVSLVLAQRLHLETIFRPVVSYAPYVSGQYANLDIAFVYHDSHAAGATVEYQLTENSSHRLSTHSRAASELLMHRTFAYALRAGKTKITCLYAGESSPVKTPFTRAFYEAAASYSRIEREHYSLSEGAIQLGRNASGFDMLVVESPAGAVLADVITAASGALGMTPVIRTGENCAVFEAQQSASPEIAGQGIANPTALLQAAIQMLLHIGQADTAALIQNALRKTIEDGISTADVEGSGKQQEATTEQFTEAVLRRIGKKPEMLYPVRYKQVKLPEITPAPENYGRKEKRLVGTDIFVHWKSESDILVSRLKSYASEELPLVNISTADKVIWPGTSSHSANDGLYRCRFLSSRERLPLSEVIKLMERLQESGVDLAATENLYTFNGDANFEKTIIETAKAAATEDA